MFRIGVFVGITSSIAWSFIRKCPQSYLFKIITKTIWHPTMALTEFNYDPIDDYIILGSIPRDFVNIGELKKLGVSKVLTMNEDWELDMVSDPKYAGIRRVQFSTPDFNAPSIDVIISSVREIIKHTNKSDPSGKLYVHCKAGKGRSAIVIICYHMVCKQCTVIEAIEYVKKRRPSLRLNDSQLESIYEFNKIMKEEFTDLR